MFTIIDIIKSYLCHKRFKQSFSDQIKHIVKKDPFRWEYRVAKSAKSILTAVCFRETAIASSETKDSLIYQPIGLYYSMFHMSLAMLWLNPRINSKELANIHHPKLINMVESQLVQTGFIESSFHHILVNLKQLRESCNYRFGYKNNLELELTKAINMTEKAFDNALEFIHQVLNASDSLFRVQGSIGDGFGDDILDSYLSPEHKENVCQYLVINGLST